MDTPSVTCCSAQAMEAWQDHVPEPTYFSGKLYDCLIGGSNFSVLMERLSLRCVRLPVVRQQLIGPVLRMRGQTCEHILQIGMEIKTAMYSVLAAGHTHKIHSAKTNNPPLAHPSYNSERDDLTSFSNLLMMTRNNMFDIPSTNVLVAFITTAQHASIRQSADVLCLTPAAVSKQIRNLESFLGCRLFDRTNRGLNLNAQGELYYQRILPLIQGLQQSTEIIRKQNTKRSIRIRAHSTFCVYWLIPRLADFYNKYRDINVELLTVSGMFPVTHDDVDATIRLGNGTWPGVSSLALTRNVVAPACSPEIAKSLRKPDDLAGHTLLHSKARKHDWRSWLQAVQCTEVDPDTGRTYDSSILSYQAAAKEQGISIAQISLIEPEIDSNVLTLPFSKALDMGSYTYYLTLPENKEMTGDVDIFKHWLIEQQSAKEIQGMEIIPENAFSH